MNKKIILFSTLTIIVFAIIVILILRGGMFSKEILRFEILGPESAKLGEEVEYTITYKNNGNFVLEQAKLTFELPENSLTEDGRIKFTKILKDIYPGNQDSVIFKARLLGKDGELKNVKATLSYIPKNITATYESESSFITKIDASPITLDFDLPTKSEQGKNLQFSVNYFSNIDYPLENLSLKIDPVAGFEVISSSPASLDSQEWKLPTLNKAQGGRVNITGKTMAGANQELEFSAKLGIWKNGKFIEIKEAKAKVQSIEALLLISQQVNGSASYVASPSEVLNYEIFFRNIGSSSFENLFMVVKLDGQALDLSSIQPNSGGQAQGNMIVWGHNQTPELKSLGVQEEGRITFSVKVKSDWNPSSDPNSAVIVSEVNISQIVQKFTIKVNSGLLISQAGFFANSGIANSGPTPPKAGRATTYTINWEIRNYFSDAKNVKVKAVLPKNVSLTGRIMPENELANFSFDSASREIVWSAGDILAGTGVNGDPVSLSFQISLTPDVSQKGSAAPLIGQVQIFGENQFTNTIITARDAAVDTLLPDDFTNSGGGLVQ